jgi:iron complex transport system substrate-binding protein
MKRKNKLLALLEIAVVLCSVLLVTTLPAAAITNYESGITNYEEAAQEDDYVLNIYGNANEDDTIDMRDLTYVKLIFFGKKPETEFADAKYDSEINPLDFIQIKLIIVGKEKEITVVDDAERIVTVKKPIERIVCARTHLVETLRSLKVQKSKIVGLVDYTIEYTSYFPEFGDVECIGPWSNPDIEKILEINPDVILCPGSLSPGSTREQVLVKQLEAVGMTVCCFNTDPETYSEEVTKLGYIFDKEKEAEEFLDFYEKFLNSIKEVVEKIPEEDKPKVYSELGYKAYYIGYPSKDNYIFTMTGCRNIFADMPSAGLVDPEAVAVRNPDIIICMEIDDAGARAVGDTAKLEKVREQIMGRPMLKNVAAVKNEKVYIITSPIWTYMGYSGCRYFVGRGYLAKWFHPELFEDLDPKQIHQEYLTRFQGLDIDLDEKGVFVYPEPG